MSHRTHPVTGAGLGLRRALLGPLQDHAMESVDFMEVAPENWINVGGKLGRAFRSILPTAFLSSCTAFHYRSEARRRWMRLSFAKSDA